MLRKSTIKIGAGLFLAIALSLASASSALAQSADVVRPPLSDYEGSFEGREFLIEDHNLTYYRSGMQNSIGLEALGDDHFGIVIPPGAVVQTQGGHEIPTFKFERDDDGHVVKLIIVAPSGDVMSEHPRTGDVKPVGSASPEK